MSNESKALVPIEQQQVIFYGDELTAALVHIPDADKPEVYVPVRPICEYLEISWTGQHDRIRRDPVLTKAMSIVRVTRTIDDTRPYDMLCLPLDFIHGWLFSISAARIKDESKRAKLIRYQEKCYRALANVFLERSLPTEASSTMATLVQVREMGKAIMQMAEEQMEFELRLTKTEDTIGQTVVIVDDLNQRVSSLEKRIAPGKPVTDEQASQVSQAVKAVAMILTKQSGSSQYGAVYGELYRKFGITSYKLLPANSFQEAMDFLDEWHASLVDDVAF